MLPRVILAIQQSGILKQFKEMLSNMDVLVSSVRSTKALWKTIAGESADFIFISKSLLPDPVENTMSTIKSTPECPQVIVITDDETEVVRETGKLLGSGCDAVLPKDLTVDVFGEIFTTLIEKRRETSKLKLTAQYSITEPNLSDFVSESPAMQAFMDVVNRVVDSSSSLLILGETGVGKERLARAIHEESPRAKGPFIAVNCAAFPDALLESELFGHVEGAFTGASRTRRGCFEMSHGGTVFLDEIGEIPTHLQVKLLRVLQEREVQPIGSERPINIDVRIMAATNRDLEEAIANQEFRPDLYYRISVVTLNLPPLRERCEDIRALVENYIAYFSENLSRRIEGITPDALAALISYPWPGNVRELMNVIERAVLLCRGSEITPEDLPSAIMAARPVQRLESNPAPDPLGMMPPAALLKKSLKEVREEAIERAETAYLKALLQDTRGRVGDTAKRAGLQTRSLFEKMRRYGLRKEDFRQQNAGG